MNLGLSLSLGGMRAGGGAALPAFDDYGFDYVEDFETAGEINGVNSFESLAGNGRFTRSSGALRMPSSFLPFSVLLWGPTGGFPENVKFKWGYNTAEFTPETVFDETRTLFFVWHVDSNNRIEVAITPSSSRLAVTRRIAGVNTNLRFNNVTYLAQGEIELHCVNGFMRVKLDGKWLIDANKVTYPFDAQDLTAVSSGNRIARVGAAMQTRRFPVAYDMAASPIYMAIDDHSNFFARDSKDSLGVTGRGMSGKYFTRTPSQFAYRVLDYGTGAVVQDWLPLENATFGAGSWSGEVSAPTGGPYTFQHAMIDDTGKWHLADSFPVLVGALYTYDGQSNSSGRNTAFAIPKVQDAMSTFAFNNYAGRPSDSVVSLFNTASTPAAYNAAAEAAESMGVPVCVAVLGISGLRIEALSASDATNWARVTTLITDYGAPEGVIWDQGEGNADSPAAPTDYSTLWTTLASDWRSAAGNPDLPFLIVDVGRFASSTRPSGAPSDVTGDLHREILRQQKRDIIANDPTRVFLAPNHLGQEHVDSYHYTGQGYARGCERDGYSIARHFAGVNIPDGRGPFATGANLNVGRDQITLTFDMNGAASLTDLVNRATGTVPTPPLSDGLYGYQVSINDFTSLLPISTIVRSGNTLVITLSAAAPAGTVKVRSMYGWSYDDTNLFYGTGYADGRSDIPVDAIAIPLVAS